MEEIWKDIPEFEGIYQASNLGRIKSLEKIVNHWQGGNRKVKEKIFNCYVNKRGYQIVTLHKDGKMFSKKVHRLIALTFISNPENKNDINHKDGNKLNNNAKNLEWCTSKENINHSWKLGLSKSSEKQKQSIREYIAKNRVGKGNPNSKLITNDILHIRKVYVKYKNSKELATKYGVSQKTINKIARKESWKHI